MPPKSKDQGASKKTEQKKKQKVIEDKTFGLKNKNKSKKVQQHIDAVTRTVMNSGDRRQRALEEQRKQERAALKAARKAEKDEQDALFGAALLSIQKKTTTNTKEGKNEAKGRDADAEGKKGTSRAMKMMFQMDAQEMEAKLKEDVSTQQKSSTVLSNPRDLELMDRYLFVFNSQITSRHWKMKLKQNDRRKLQNSRKLGKVHQLRRKHLQLGKKRNGKSARKLPKNYSRRKCEKRKVERGWECFLEEICLSTRKIFSM